MRHLGDTTAALYQFAAFIGFARPYLVADNSRARLVTFRKIGRSW